MALQQVVLEGEHVFAPEKDLRHLESREGPRATAQQ